jgi:hypothetical protein
VTEQPNWWDEYGIDPDEITAGVEAALVGADIADEWIRRMWSRILAFLAEDWAPVAEKFLRERQAESLHTVATILRRFADEVDKLADTVPPSPEQG